jgi:hypothetical protein
LADIATAEQVDELVVGSPRKLDGALHGHLTLSLGGKTIMLLAINHLREPQNANGTVDWARVRRLKLVRIGEL